VSRSPARPAAKGTPPPGRPPGPRSQPAPFGMSHNGAVMVHGPGSRPLQKDAKAAPRCFPLSRFYITGLLCKVAPLSVSFRRPTSGPPLAAPVRPLGLPVKTDSLGLQSAQPPRLQARPLITRPPRQRQDSREKGQRLAADMPPPRPPSRAPRIKSG
jgi:hypothetical protein